MFGLVDTNNGELPHGKIETYPIESLRTAVYVASKIISKLPYERGKIPFFGFPIRVDNTFGLTEAEYVVNQICANELPSNVELYIVGGRSLFDLRGESGGVTMARIFYIMRKKD